jgi:hypothetical protein
MEKQKDTPQQQVDSKNNKELVKHPSVEQITEVKPKTVSAPKAKKEIGMDDVDKFIDQVKKESMVLSNDKFIDQVKKESEVKRKEVVQKSFETYFGELKPVELPKKVQKTNVNVEKLTNEKEIKFNATNLKSGLEKEVKDLQEKSQVSDEELESLPAPLYQAKFSMKEKDEVYFNISMDPMEKLIIPFESLELDKVYCCVCGNEVPLKECSLDENDKGRHFEFCSEHKSSLKKMAEEICKSTGNEKYLKLAETKEGSDELYSLLYNDVLRNTNKLIYMNQKLISKEKEHLKDLGKSRKDQFKKKEVDKKISKIQESLDSLIIRKLTIANFKIFFNPTGIEIAVIILCLLVGSYLATSFVAFCLVSYFVDRHSHNPQKPFLRRIVGGVLQFWIWEEIANFLMGVPMYSAKFVHQVGSQILLGIFRNVSVPSYWQ